MTRTRQPAPSATGSGPGRRPAGPLQHAAAASAAARRLDGLQTLADARARPAQRAALEEEEPLQGKLAQRMGLEEEEPLQGKLAQRMGLEEEEPLQARLAQRTSLEEGPVEATLAQQADRAPPAGGSALPAPLRDGIESLSGLAMDAVRVHYGSPRPAQLAAHAFAQGTDIHLAPGQERHLPHEAWHVVQQAEGRVAPTASLAGTPLNDDPALEAEADRMGARAAALPGRTPDGR